MHHSPARGQPQLQDEARLTVLRRSALLDTPAEAAFDRLTRLATRILNVPVALVSLVDADRQFFKSCIGLPEPWASQRETPLSHSFCQHTLDTNEPLIIDDARAHPLVQDSLAIEDLGVVTYAGIPLTTPDGWNLGTFCAIDTAPRVWTDEDVAVLTDLAAATMTEIELRFRTEEAQVQAAALRSQARLLQAQNEALPIGLLVVDAQGRMLTFNRRFVDLWRMPANVMASGSDAAALQVAAEQLVNPEQFLARVHERYAHPDTLDYDELVFRDGRVFERHGAPAVGEDGVYYGWVWFFADITARKHAETERERLLARERAARQDAEQAVQLRDQVLATVSHDLKSPLATIKGFTQLLLRLASRDRTDHTQLVTILTQMDQTTTTMSTMMDELLATARLHMGEPLTLHQQSTNLGALVQRVVAMQQERTTVHHIRSVPAEPELVGEWDAARLERVVDNLIGNAIKYSPAGGEVTATLRHERGDGAEWAVLSIADQGLGIPSADLPHVFEPFRRASNVGQIAGTGVGLAGVKQIVEQHGGSIGVESMEGSGSLFTVRLPLT